MIITGIGSRETPENILKEMTKIGQFCKEKEIYLRSGHAPGADWAFEQGAQDFCIAYLPWKGFGKELVSKANHIVPEDMDLLRKHAAGYHPAWNRLSDPVKLLMARNSAQILGISLNRYTDVVICWTKDGGPSGGTGQALRIAQHAGIEILNMYYKENNTAKKICEYITNTYLT